MTHDLLLNYDEFASGLPRDRTFSFTSAEEKEEELLRSGVCQPMRQMGKGKFCSSLAVLGTEQRDLFSDRYNTAISLYLEPPAGMARYQVVLQAIK